MKVIGVSRNWNMPCQWWVHEKVYEDGSTVKISYAEYVEIQESLLLNQ